MRNKQFPIENSAAVRGLQRMAATGIDSLMCVSMNLVQLRHRLHAGSHEEIEHYIAECEKLTVHDFYAVPQSDGITTPTGDERGATVTWRSPVETKFPANNIAR